MGRPSHGGIQFRIGNPSQVNKHKDPLAQLPRDPFFGRGLSGGPREPPRSQACRSFGVELRAGIRHFAELYIAGFHAGAAHSHAPSVYAPHPAVLVETENCYPLVGCTIETTIDQNATRDLRQTSPLGRFVGLNIYQDRGHLAVVEVGAIWATAESWGAFWSRLFNLPLYRALSFTLTYAFVVTPLLIVFGLTIALAVNSLHRHLKALMIFFSLLPMIVTPLIGSLILF